MKIDLTDKNLTLIEKDEIEKLLKREKQGLDDLEQMWYLMDLIWDDYHCDNKNLNWDKIGEFYSHPVWILNGLFQEQHALSMQHRHAISDWIIKKEFEKVVDYGGGFGTLARLIAHKDVNIHVDIYEPHPSDFGLKRVNEYVNIDMIDTLDINYDCLLSTDVLEHVPDPLSDFYMMIESVKMSGYLVIANAFQPMIQCHLPHNFHFRYTFDIFAKLMGLKVIGKLEGSHAMIYQKVLDDEPNWKKLRLWEKISKCVFPIIEFLKPILKLVRRRLSQ